MDSARFKGISGMRIIVLDGHALNPGDLSWAALQALGDCTVHERTSAAQVLTRATGAPVLLTNKTRLGRAEIAQLPELRYIGLLATGYNVVDVNAASERGIVVTNVPAYSTRSVAQMVFALVLEHTQQVGRMPHWQPRKPTPSSPYPPVYRRRQCRACPTLARKATARSREQTCKRR